MSLKSDLNRFQPRKEQKEALDFIISTKSSSPNTKFFLLDLPVGLGKSHITLMIADWYINNINKSAKIDVVTAGKILQDQYDDTYECISNLKGKDNYECTTYACGCGQGKEFNRLNKTSCEACPYDDAKNNFIGGKVSLTNFYLYLIYALYNNGVIESRKSNVLIVDEAHEFDEVLSDFISIKITESIVKRLKFTNEYDIISKLNKISNIDSYISFLTYLTDEIVDTISSIENSMGIGRNAVSDKRDLKITKISGGVNSDVKLMQIISDLRQYLLKIDIFLKEYKENPHNWVLETTFNEKNNQKELSLEPIWAYDYLEKYVWSRYDMVVLMSGTILDKELFSELNGLDASKTAYYSIDSPFPLKNRKVYYMPLGKMSYNKKDETFKNYVPFIHKILKKYKNQKGIIHTNSFELSKWIENGVKDTRLLFHDSLNKDEILRSHFESEDPTVIVSPSVGTGVSFDHDRSRFQVIAKIPYPSLGSQKNKLRQKNNPKWYSWKTVCGIIQMSGRSIRSFNDYADTIIIDGSFSDIIKYSSDLMPHWFQEAIKRVDVKIEA